MKKPVARTKADRSGLVSQAIDRPSIRFLTFMILACLTASIVTASESSGAPQSGIDLPIEFHNPARGAFRSHEITAKLDPATAHLSVTDQLLLTHPAGISGDAKVPFLLNSSLKVTSLKASLGDSPVAVSHKSHPRWFPNDFWSNPEYAELSGYDHARQIDLYLDQTGPHLEWPESLLITIEYEGTLYDSLQAPPSNYQRGFETSTGLIDARGAFLAGSSLWYPERFGEPITFNLTAYVPDNWQVISQGAPKAIDQPLSADSSGSFWQSSRPMDEIYLIAGPYTVREETASGVLMQTYTYGNDDEELCRTYLSATRDYLDLYGRLIGPYPFAKFAMVENFWQTGYGMPSFTLLGDKVIRLPWIVHTSYGHEILHNWWGNGVFVDWEKGNWCEGLTVYGADYLYKEQESEAVARDYRRTQLQGYLDYVGQKRDFPLTEFRSRHDASSAAVGYNKSMMIYHMIRRLYGDDHFWGSLQEFYRSYLYRRASWKDLLAILLPQTNESMESFYDEWIARAGAPTLTLGDVSLIPAKESGWQLTYTLQQDQPVYSLTVPVRATFGEREPETWQVDLSGTACTESRSFDRQPLTLEVDPDFDLFRKLHREEVPSALSQLFGADSLAMVVCEETPKEIQDIYNELTSLSAKSKPTGRFSDSSISPGDLRHTSAWIMGAPWWLTQARHLLPSELQLTADGFTIGGQAYRLATHTLVLAVSNPDSPNHAIGLLIGGDATGTKSIWRKLPHYGKYSYLVFEGSKNVAKGSWQVTSSPLKTLL